MPRYSEHYQDICPEGDYVCELISIEDARDSKDRPMWLFKFDTTETMRDDGNPYRLFCKCFPSARSFAKMYDENNLWVLDMCDKPDFDFDTLVGMTFLVSVYHKEYKGKTYANIYSIRPYSAEDIGDPFAEE